MFIRFLMTKKIVSRIKIKPPEIKTVREKLNVSLSEFALMIGVSVRTLQNWEQGRRKPEGPAKALLRIASKNPRAVPDALHGNWEIGDGHTIYLFFWYHLCYRLLLCREKQG